jgi:hypothetical protein
MKQHGPGRMGGQAEIKHRRLIFQNSAARAFFSGRGAQPISARLADVGGSSRMHITRSNGRANFGQPSASPGLSTGPTVARRSAGRCRRPRAADHIQDVVSAVAEARAWPLDQGKTVDLSVVELHGTSRLTRRSFSRSEARTARLARKGASLRSSSGNEAECALAQP